MGCAWAVLSNTCFWKKQRYYKRQSIQKRILICIWLPAHLTLSWDCTKGRKHSSCCLKEVVRLDRTRDISICTEAPWWWCDRMTWHLCTAWQCDGTALDGCGRGEECFHPYCEHHVPFSRMRLELKNVHCAAELLELPPGSSFEELLLPLSCRL